MSAGLFFWLAVAVLLFWALGAYNRLVRLRAQVIALFAGVDQRMTQALDLLGEAVAGPGEVDAAGEDAPGAATGDDTPPARSGLQAAAVQFEVALRVARKQPLDPGAMAALQTAYATVHVVWERRRNQTPDADATARAVMQRAWEDNTQVVREAEAGYNAAVQDYNGAIAQFPASVLAYLFGFGPAASL